MAVTDRLWGVDDVAQYLGIPKSAVYKLTMPQSTSAVRVPVVRLGRRLRFSKTEIDRWLAALTVSNVGFLERVRDELKRGSRGISSQAG